MTSDDENGIMSVRFTWRVRRLRQAEIHDGVVNFVKVTENLRELSSSDCNSEVRVVSSSEGELTLVWMSTNGMLIFLACTIEFDPNLLRTHVRLECGRCECMRLPIMCHANHTDCGPTKPLRVISYPGAKFHPGTKQLAACKPASRRGRVYIGWS